MTDRRCVDTIRCLSAAQVQAANSGHPGTPMGCAPVAHALFRYVMNYDANDPKWWNRDRFVLSAGHGCALLYSMLHLSGYDVSKQDLKNFRQLHSKCPGHPECFITPGVEVCSGPLGQGISQAVGMAIAGQHLKAKYNKPNFDLFDNYVFTLAGEGCLEEGVSGEACSLAGHLELGNLIAIFDCNKITIDGDSALSFSENVAKRYRAYGWHVQDVADGNHDINGMRSALLSAKSEKKRPSLIIIHTVIGYGAAKEGTAKVHGAPLGAEDLKVVREKFQLPESDDWFLVEDEVNSSYKIKSLENSNTRNLWNKMWEKYQKEFPTEAAELTMRFSGGVPESVINALPRYTPADKAVATRASSGAVLNVVAPLLPQLIGGSADLTESNKSGVASWKDFNIEDRLGQYIRYGVREHGMAAISNGLFAYGGFMPFWATFLNFVTYAWGAVRLSCLSRFQILGLATHDSIELGEDGPTHQPIETLALLRATPQLHVVRPCDANEVSGAYGVWLKSTNKPTIISLCRDAVPVNAGSSPEKVMEGAYVLQDFLADSTLPRVVLGSSGTEIPGCMEAVKLLEGKANVRVVSCPCWSLFLEKDVKTRNAVVAKDDKLVVARIYIEAACALGAERMGFDDVIEMSTFGESAPRKDLYKHFGFDAASIAQKVISRL